MWLVVIGIVGTIIFLWYLLKWIGTGLGQGLGFLLFGRTYSKSDCEQQMRDARHLLRKGKITEDQFLDIEYEFKKRYPNLKNY